MRTSLLFCVVLAACSSGPNGSEDGGGSSDAAFSGVPPIDLGGWNQLPDADGGSKAFYRQVAKAQLGQSADFDLDGIDEVTVVHLPDGTTRWVIEGDGNHPAAIIERTDTHKRTTLYFLNYSAPIQIEDAESTGARVLQVDADLNRVIDRRRTEQPLDDGGIEVVEQQLTDAGFTEVDRFTLSTSAEQRAANGCKGADNIPSDNLLFGGTTGIVIQTDGPSKCDAMQISKLDTALQCARDRLRDCVQQNNPELANRVQAALATKGLKMGCGNPCTDVDASTEEGFWNASARMNFNPNSLMTLTPDELCAVMMHELSHYAGTPRDSHHDEGKDQIYNCARYCAHCVTRGPSGGSPARDCARCASFEGARKQCGLDRRLEAISCPTLALCHGGLGVNESCTSCEGLLDYDCDGKQFSGAGQFSCCDTCSANASRVNDKPCPALSASNGCNMQPAGCK